MTNSEQLKKDEIFCSKSCQHEKLEWAGGCRCMEGHRIYRCIACGIFVDIPKSEFNKSK